jgi:multiple sugar transport system substrate-binding protein
MKITRKAFAPMTVLLLSLSLLAGCGKKATPAASAAETVSATGSAKESQEPASKKAVSLRFLDTSPSPARQAYYEDIFSQVKDKLGITVTYESTPLADAANKITVMAQANSLPDIMTVQDNWKGQFTAAKWIIPLESYIGDTADEYADTVTKIVWANEKQLYGHIYTVPDGMMVKGIFVRKDWAQDAGIDLDYGWNYDQYFDVIKGLTDPDKRHYGMTYRGTRGAFDVLMVYLQTFTGGRTYDDEGNCLFRSPECLNAFIKYTDTYMKGYAPKESINWGFVEMVDNFCGGLTGTLNNDSEVAATCLTEMKDDQWTVLPIPHSTVDGKIYNTVNAPYSYAISKNCKDIEATWKVIEFLSEPENNIKYCKTTGEIPIKKAVGDDPYFGPDGPYATFVKELSDPNLVVPTGYGAWDSTEIQQGPLFQEIQKYLLGEEDAKTSLGNICTMLEKGMKKYLAEHEGATVDTPKTMQ